MEASRLHLMPLRLRLTVKLSLESPKLSGVYRPKPITASRFLQKHTRSKGPSLLRHYPASQVIWPSPTPARTSTKSAVAGRDPVSGTGLPRCPRYLPDMLSPLPRWIGIGGSVTSLSRCGLPRILGGSASTTVLSGPAQGSLALRPARLLQPYRLTSVPRAPAGRSPYPTVWVATGMNQQFPGRNSHPLAPCALVAHPICCGWPKTILSPLFRDDDYKAI